MIFQKAPPKPSKEAETAGEKTVKDSKKVPDKGIGLDAGATGGDPPKKKSTQRTLTETLNVSVVL